MPRPSNRKTKNMVFSRPRKSETQPKNGLVSPLRTRSIVNANVSAGRVMPINVMGVVSRWKSLAMGFSCAVAISPPAAINTNITYMTQNVGSIMMPIANAIIGSLQLPLVSCSLALGPITVSKDRRRQIAGTFSGGEQQMLAIARGLMSDPGILIIDELSLGLAPVVVHQLFDTLKALKETGISILLVEQNVHLALAISGYPHVMAQGKLFTESKLAELAKRPDIRQAYLGL